MKGTEKSRFRAHLTLTRTYVAPILPTRAVDVEGNRLEVQNFYLELFFWL